MAGENELSTEEAAFFETKGEAPAAVAPEPEPAKDAPAAKEPAKEDAAPADGEKGGDLKVALKQERERRRAEAAARQEAELKYAKLQSRLDTLQELATTTVQPQQAKAPDEIPDINVDPVGHFRAKDAIREREIAELRAWKQNQERQGQELNNVQRISQIAQAQEAEFVKETPDYNDASTHLREMRAAQLRAYGITDPAQIQSIIAQDAITIAANALAQQKNPAKVIYEMAKASGFTGKAPAPAAAQKVVSQEEAKIDMAAKGQKAGSSVGQIGGAATPPTTMEALASMSDEEFAEATKGNKWQRLFTG